jgi:hypothetical protein
MGSKLTSIASNQVRENQLKKLIVYCSGLLIHSNEQSTMNNLKVLLLIGRISHGYYSSRFAVGNISF